MKINVFSTQSSVHDKDLKDQIVVVVDVLRATTTIITALYNGCREVIPLIDIEEAVKMARNYEKDSYLLGGERNAQLIEGFDLSNSPLEYTKDAVKGKTVIFTTTNGTKAIKKAADAKKLIIAGIVNAGAVCKFLSDIGEDVTFICAGTEGKFSLDDIIAVGAIIDKLNIDEDDIELDDLALVCRYLYRTQKQDIDGLLSKAYHYRRLKSAGFSRDIEYCLTPDCAPIVPFYQDGIIRCGDKF